VHNLEELDIDDNGIRPVLLDLPPEMLAVVEDF
jgi:hypothetical protein